MSRLLVAVLVLAVCAVASVSAVHVSEFDSTVSAFDEFASLLELTEQHEADTNQHLTDSEEDLALLEVSEGEGDNPSYTLAYPPITYAAHAAGGFIHPFSNVNPLAAPWAGFAPVAGPARYVPSAAAIGATPLSAYFAGALHPVGATALGINTGLYPAAFHMGGDAAKGGYNVHGLNAGNVFGGYHPGLSADLTSLGGKAGAGGEAAGGGESGGEESSFMESSAASELKAQSDAELDAELAIDADADALLEGSSDADASDMTDAEFESIDPMDNEAVMLEVQDDDESGGEGGEGGEGGGGGGGEGGANPSYTLPYPPVLPGHYSPLFNPYTNVNPLSTPFSNYAAQPGAHPGVAAAAAAQAGVLAAVNGQIAGAGNGYPFYPFNAAAGLGAVQAGVPFSGYGGWIHPQNLNSASVGENADAASLGQFIEVATEQTEHGECVNCSY